MFDEIAEWECFECWLHVQVRCRDERLCKKEGVKILVTDTSRTNQTGFVLSKEAFMALGHDGMAHDLMQQRNLDVQFRRLVVLIAQSSFFFASLLILFTF